MARKIPFDTHVYVKKAKLVGFTDAQAEFQAEELSHILWDGLDDRLDQLATKAELNAVFEKLDTKIDSLETRLDAKIATIDARISAVDTKLTWLVSLFGMVSIIFTIFSFIRLSHII